MNGLLVIDKPGGMTSRAAVDRAQAWFRRKTKLGHTGTLDPLATGVLVVCVGLATRLAHFVQAMEKSYLADVRLGCRSETDDADGVLTPVPDAVPPTEAELQAVLQGFQGAVSQRPPDFSAIKVNGQRAHKLARKGRDVPMSERTIEVHSLRLLNYAWPIVQLEIECSKGTYIRSIARDLGDRLGCGGLVQSLRRTRIGPFTTEHAVSLDLHWTEARKHLRPMLEAVAELPGRRHDSGTILRIKEGQRIVLDGPDGMHVLLDEAGELVCLGDVQQNLFSPKLVFKE